MKSMFTPKYIDILSRWIIAAIFSISAVMKMTSFRDTTVAVLGYEIIGISLASYVAIGLISMEIVMAVWGFSGWKKQLFHQVTITIFVVFIMLIISAWVRGLEINCGCFGSSEVPDNPIVGYIKDIIRDCIFIAISGAGLWSVSTKNNGGR